MFATTLLPCLLTFLLTTQCHANQLLIIHEPTDPEPLQILLESGLLANYNLSVVTKIAVAHDAIDNDSEFCKVLPAQPISAVVDLSFGSWSAARKTSARLGLPYLHVDASNGQFVSAVDDFLFARDSLDVALLFENETELDQSLHRIIGRFQMRLILLSLDELGAGARDPFRRMKALRPVPSSFVAFGTAGKLRGSVVPIVQRMLVEERQNVTMVKRDSRWLFVIEDFGLPSSLGLNFSATIASMTARTCCGLAGITIPKNNNNNSTESNTTNCLQMCHTKPRQVIVRRASRVLGQAAMTLTPRTYTCTDVNNNNNDTRNKFSSSIKDQITGEQFTYDDDDKDTFTFPLEIDFRLTNSTVNDLLIGRWNEADKFAFSNAFKNNNNTSSDRLIRRFLRVGMSISLPWFFQTKNERGETVYTGYCLELMQRLAEKLDVDFEVVITKEKRPGYTYGRKLDDGSSSWSGMIGDLDSGEIDLIVADLTMTSEREEVIDFVSPYFDQAGMSIVLRKRLRKQSLFKFLSVLKPEVWLGIVVAVVSTALLLWLLDRHSPYSSRNKVYPEPCRQFTLRESFWFALTSLTPQGGGESPKALSGRVLVAAYWLFVVLMLATFTANLAAFLTVERLQTTVQSLEELARQSKINYTVVDNTSFMEYFVNMAGAEEELYHKWKELTLGNTDNNGGNAARYRVWDYPIREQYTHLLKVIKDSGPVSSTLEGLYRVQEHEEGDFAFIHDAARIRYEVYNNCNLTEVGEPFAEQPYALAVQQGSRLKEELSRAILELQKDRFFETLQSSYWNSSLKNDCPVLDDSEGITLQSLGGVFIATVIGLGMALVALAVEVAMRKREERKVAEMEKKKGKEEDKATDVAAAVVLQEKKKEWTEMPKVYY